jgi:hypothetical protein
MNDSRPEDVLCVCLGCIDGISDAMFLRGDGPSLGDLWAPIPRDAWDLNTRRTLAIRIEAAYYKRLVIFYARYPERRPKRHCVVVPINSHPRFARDNNLGPTV